MFFHEFHDRRAKLSFELSLLSDARSRSRKAQAGPLLLMQRRLSA